MGGHIAAGIIGELLIGAVRVIDLDEIITGKVHRGIGDRIGDGSNLVCVGIGDGITIVVGNKRDFAGLVVIADGGVVTHAIAHVDDLVLVIDRKLDFIPLGVHNRDRWRIAIGMDKGIGLSVRPIQSQGTGHIVPIKESLITIGVRSGKPRKRDHTGLKHRRFW